MEPDHAGSRTTYSSGMVIIDSARKAITSYAGAPR